MSKNHTPFSSVQSGPQHKESEPIGSGNTEYLKQVEQPEVSEEVVEYLKHHDAATKKLPQDLKDLGVSSPQEPLSLDGPTLPLSDEKIMKGLSQPISSSLRWLSELMRYLLKQAHYSLKVVGGHVKRVLSV